MDKFTRGFVTGLGISLAYGILSHKLIPISIEVEEGSVPPSHLEILIKDTNGDGMKETLFEINGSRFGLVYDSNKVPTLRYEGKTP